MSARMGDELALDLALQGRVQPPTAQVERLAALAGTLAELPDPQIDPKFAAALEARLLEEEIEGEQAPARPERHLTSVPAAKPAKPAAEPRPAQPARRAPVVPLPRRRLVLRRGLVAAVAAAMLMAFPIAAGASALPGTPFYPIKTGVIERIELAFAGDDVGKGMKHLDFAQRRAEEAVQLVALGAAEALVADTAAAQAREAETGASLILGATDDPAVLSRVMTIVSTSAESLSALLPGVSGAAEPALLGAIETNRAIASQLASVLGIAAPATSGPAVAGVAGDASSSAGSTSSNVATSSDTIAGDGSAPAPDAPDAPEGPEAPDPNDADGTAGDDCGSNGLGPAEDAVNVVTGLLCDA